MASKNDDRSKGRRGKEEGLPTVRSCGTEHVHLRLLLDDPEYARRRASIENHAWRASRILAEPRTGCTRIPVVVHVVHRTNAENIDRSQVDSQIAVLNDDFRRRNGDIGTVPAAFQGAVADSRVEFELATTAPDGSPTDGITRTRTTVNGFTSDDAVKSTATGGADPWPSDQYLNLWVCRMAGGLLGYAQFPGGPAATDGIVVTLTGFGTSGTAAAPFDRGRTAVHEVGHWLNLRHIWGDDAGGCGGSDLVVDTPNQAGPNTGVPAFPTVSCANGPNGDMFMNYMDYVDDAAMVMFSDDQVTRMQAALDGPRSAIGTSISCGPKLKFADDPVTLKFRDDPIGTLKFSDDPITLKFRDDPGTLKFKDDPGTLKFSDDPITLKFRDDPGTLKFKDDPGTLKFKDDPVGTFKATDDVKAPALDPQPGGDPFGQPTVGTVPGQPAPFILATPHHSDAWQQVAPAGAETANDPYEQRLAEYERVLQECARAEAAGELSPRERPMVEALYAEYVQLGEEYRRTGGGGA
ncbi:MAG: zinc metalloprotease [Chloroflexota bacterium]